MKTNLILTGKITAILSFVIGTILLAFYLYFGESFIPITLGLGFVAVALIINTVLFIACLGSAIIYHRNRIELLKTCGLMLLNIPISIGYFYMVITFNSSTFI
jgi:hypothetical protein